MNSRVLTDAQIEQFITLGFVKLEEAYPRKTALAAQGFIWDKIEAATAVRRDDPQTWTEPMVHIRELLNGPEFQACATARLSDAIEDLVGRGRWATRNGDHNWGWWPVNFSAGADRPWDVPTGGWHWDGMGRHHFVNSPEQGLLLLPVFSDIGPQGGATLVAGGSHQVVARFLAGYPEGIEKEGAGRLCEERHPWLAALTGRLPSDGDRIDQFMNNVTVDDEGTELRVFETTACAGDVMLCHPFLYHAASQNQSGVPRFMCNRATPLTGPIQLDRPDGDYSPLEISIRQAISPQRNP